MALSLIGLVIVVGFVLLLSTKGGRRERRRPPHLSSAPLQRWSVVQEGRVRRPLAWLLRPSTDDRYRRWLSGGGGFGGLDGFGDGGGGGCGGDGGC